MDLNSVAAAFKGVYGAYVNTDGFTVGEEAEIFHGMRIFELAKQAGVQHYVWSNLDYVSKARTSFLSLIITPQSLILFIFCFHFFLHDTEKRV